MAESCQYFYEDEIYLINRIGKLEMGMVLENCEYGSSDESSDEDDEKVERGKIKVAWYPSGDEEVVNENKVGLANRSLMPGDVVQKIIKGKDTQRGYCKDVKISATVNIVGTEYVIVDVHSNDLIPLEEFADDIAVSLDSWVGMVTSVKCKIFLITCDGLKCTMKDSKALLLDDFKESRDKDSEFRRCDFYPGQQLFGRPKLFECADWEDRNEFNLLSKSKKKIKVTVEKIKVVKLSVKWQCRAFTNDPNCDKVQQPKYHIQGDDLERVRMLNVFEPSTLQLGDRNFYLLKESDFILEIKEWNKLTSRALLEDKNNPFSLRKSAKAKKKQKSKRFKSNSREDVSNICETKKSTKKDNARFNTINENDSDTESYESDVFESEKSTKNASKKVKKSFKTCLKPGKTKKLKGTKIKNEKITSNLNKLNHKPGDRLIVETIYTVSTADVVWQDGSVEKGIQSTLLYPVHHLDEQEFFPGDFVVEQEISNLFEYGVVQKVDHVDRTAFVKWFEVSKSRSAESPSPCFKFCKEMSVYDIRDHPYFKFRPGSVVVRVNSVEEEGNLEVKNGFLEINSDDKKGSLKENLENNTCSKEKICDKKDSLKEIFVDSGDQNVPMKKSIAKEAVDKICPTGQVLDNLPTGEVHVWWVDNTTSLIHPHNLYKVGEYDSDDGELWGNGNDDFWLDEAEGTFSDTDGSWETESETSISDEVDVEKVIEISRNEIFKRFEKLFAELGSFDIPYPLHLTQYSEIFSKLLNLQKECKVLDKWVDGKWFNSTNSKCFLNQKKIPLGDKLSSVTFFEVMNWLQSAETFSTHACEFKDLSYLCNFENQTFQIKQPNSAETIKNCDNILKNDDKSTNNSESTSDNANTVTHIDASLTSMSDITLKNDFTKSSTTTIDKVSKSDGKNSVTLSENSNSDVTTCVTVNHLLKSENNTLNSHKKISKSEKNILNSDKISCKDDNDEAVHKNEQDALNYNEITANLRDNNNTSLNKTTLKKIASEKHCAVCLEISPYLEESLQNLFGQFPNMLKSFKSDQPTDLLETILLKLCTYFHILIKSHLMLAHEEFLGSDRKNVRIKFKEKFAECCALKKEIQTLRAQLDSFNNGQSTRANFEYFANNCDKKTEVAKVAKIDSTENSEEINNFSLNTELSEIEKLKEDTLKPKVAISDSNLEKCDNSKPNIVEEVYLNHSSVNSNSRLELVGTNLDNRDNPYLNTEVRGSNIEKDDNSSLSTELENYNSEKSENSNLNTKLGYSSLEKSDNYNLNVELEDNIIKKNNAKTVINENDSNIDNNVDRSNAPVLTESPFSCSNVCSSSEANGAFVSQSSLSEVKSDFVVLENAPSSHKFYNKIHQDQRKFHKIVRNEMQLLKTSLPNDIWVRTFEDRMDLFSVMIGGPSKTPYEGGLFFFDFQLPIDYPTTPPKCHYITYCVDRMNPNLYEDGKVCISLLGTWTGKGTEMWTSQSNLLQAIVSIQGLILCSEPYYNEAGYEKQIGTQQGKKNSRRYNEMVILKLVQSMSKIVQNPPEIFKNEIFEHFGKSVPVLVCKLEKWLELSESCNASHPSNSASTNSSKETFTSKTNSFSIKSQFSRLDLPDFPLIPASKGFCITLTKVLENLKKVLTSLNLDFK